MDLGGALPALLLTLALLLANAFFVGAEFAIVRVRETQLRELSGAGSLRARLAKHLTDHIDAYLSACQVGITAASLALGIVGEPAVARVIEPAFGWLIAVSEPAFHVVSFGVAFGLITYLHIVVGEQAPKYFAIQRPLPTTLWIAYPLELFYRVMFPFIWLVNASANGFLRIFGIRPGDTLEAHSEEELKMLVAVSTRRGILQESERVLLANALDFADTLVRRVMVPRTEMVAVPDDLTLEELAERAGRHPFTRFPVFRDDLDNIVGVVHLKDLVANRDGGRSVRDIMRKPLFLPDSTHLDKALAEFRRQRVQLAIVNDEFGGTAGLVTMEDVLEELVGEVQDEFDKAAPPFRSEAEGAVVIDGLVSVDDLRERLGLELAEERSDTVAGVVLSRLGRMASVEDAVEIEGYRFEVTAVDGKRIAEVRAQRSTGRRRPGSRGPRERSDPQPS